MSSTLKLVLILNPGQVINIPTLLRASGQFLKACPIVWRVTGTLQGAYSQTNLFDNKDIILHQNRPDINLTRSHLHRLDLKTKTTTLLPPSRTMTVRPDLQFTQLDNFEQCKRIKAKSRNITAISVPCNSSDPVTSESINAFTPEPDPSAVLIVRRTLLLQA